jgi:hypothetical protein
VLCRVAFKLGQSSKDWEIWGKGTRLLILDSPDRAFLESIATYIDDISRQQQATETITVVVPQFVPERWIANFLHMPTAMLLRSRFYARKNLVITIIPYQLTGIPALRPDPPKAAPRPPHLAGLQFRPGQRD